MQLPIVAVADLISGRFWHFFQPFYIFIYRFGYRSFAFYNALFNRAFAFCNARLSFKLERIDFLPNGLPLYSVVRPMQVFGLLFCRYILNVIYPKIIRLPSANFSASRIACQTSCCLLRTRNRNERNS